MAAIEVYSNQDGNRGEALRRLHAMLERHCGPEIMGALADPKVNEVMLNTDGRVWIDKVGEGVQCLPSLVTADQGQSILATTATILQTTISFDKPILEGEFPLLQARIAGAVQPVVRAPIFAIRKLSKVVFTLDDYVSTGILGGFANLGDGRRATNVTTAYDPRWQTGFEHPVEALRAAVKERRNILIVGGTASGKTTLTNAILHEFSDLAANDRLIVIEDTAELQPKVANHVVLRATEQVSMLRLLRTTMRLRPDRIVVGEVRGGESLALIKSWNSGHPGGVATIHADSAELGLHKLASYVMEAEDARAYSSEAVCEMVASAVNLVVYIEKGGGGGRSVRAICEVEGFRNGDFQLKPVMEMKK